MNRKIAAVLSLVLGTILLSAAASPTPTQAPTPNPCESQLESKHQARIALDVCLEAWAKDRVPSAADPTDDCSSKLSEYTAATRSFKACVGDVMAKRKKKS